MALVSQRHARVLFSFKELVEAGMATLARLVSPATGTVVADAECDAQRGLDVVELACGNATCWMGIAS